MLLKTTTYLYMCHSMVVQVGAGRKPLATHLTFMRFFTWMYSPMRIQTARRTKAFPTNHAHMWFLTCNSNQKETWIKNKKKTFELKTISFGMKYNNIFVESEWNGIFFLEIFGNEKSASSHSVIYVATHTYVHVHTCTFSRQTFM